MRIQPQYGMVFNLDKCIGCHTCTIACKNLWTNREGAEYMFWNNVETKPGIGYPKEWEDQEKYKGGWELGSADWKFWKDDDEERELQLKTGSRVSELLNIFYNPVLPEMDDYYGNDPYTFTYEDLHTEEEKHQQPVARPKSQITGEEEIDITWNANWEDNGGGTHETGWLDVNFEGVTENEQRALLEYEDAFMYYLPRICNHCANPSCVASCPSGAAHKRDEDGIVLIDQDECRSWRYCVSSCPYKKPYYNWRTAKMEKCILCYPRIEEGKPPACFHSCVGRIRYIGPMLLDADRIQEAASVEDERDLAAAQREIILDPNDESVIAAAREQGISENWLEAARRSPAYKMMVEWEIALPLHPEYRELPMLWYVPPASPMRTLLEEDGKLSMVGSGDQPLPELDEYRIPLTYLANMFAAGDTDQIRRVLEKQLALRIYRRSINVADEPNLEVLEKAGLTVEQADEMHRLLALAPYDERFVIPTKATEKAEGDAYGKRGVGGFDQAGVPGTSGVFSGSPMDKAEEIAPPRTDGGAVGRDAGPATPDVGPGAGSSPELGSLDVPTEIGNLNDTGHTCGCGNDADECQHDGSGSDALQGGDFDVWEVDADDV